MKDLIYWHKYDEPKVVPNKLLGGNDEITEEWRCDHPQVKHGWITASLIYPEKKVCQAHINLMMKDGKRFDCKYGMDNDFSQAEKWIEENGYNN